MSVREGAAVMDETPVPPVQADADCRSLDAFMLNVERLLASELWALSSGDELKAALALWCRAWKQVPAGSLPNDDQVLASFSGAGRRWKKIRKMALRGFILCTDGRLYHTVLCEDVQRALKSQARYVKRRDRDSERVRKWRSERAGNANETPGETPGETRYSGPVKRVTKRVTKRVRNAAVTARDKTRHYNTRESKSQSQPAIGVSDPRARARERETGRQAGQAGLAGWLIDFEISEDWIIEAGEARRAAGLPFVDLYIEAAKILQRWKDEPPNNPHAAWMGWAIKARNGHANGSGELHKQSQGPPGPAPKPEEIWPDMKETSH